MYISYILMVCFFISLTHRAFPSVLRHVINLSVYGSSLIISFCFIYFNNYHIAFISILCILFMFICFYNDEPLKEKVRYFLGNIMLYGVLVSISFSYEQLSYHTLVILFTMGAYINFILLYRQTEKLLCIFVFILSVMFVYVSALTNTLLAVFMFISMLTMIEYIYFKNKAQYDTNTKQFQTNIMVHHYDEVKTVYLNMRGWRHDYHNHLQSLKAYLSKNQIREAQRYLCDLEDDLDRVDLLVKSGNVMIDAILNSKLSIAISKNIKINESVIAPEQLIVSDVDLCIILANIFDNAIEACEKLEDEKRFIRVYINVLQNQFYISLVNSAQEQLNDNQKNYISEKRGNHGYGMKRVKLCVDKYDGYLNLKNEPGVFACEIMLPLVHEN